MQQQVNQMMMQATAANAQRAANTKANNEAKAQAEKENPEALTGTTTVPEKPAASKGVQRVAVLGAQTRSSSISAEQLSEFDEFDNAMF